MSEGKKPGDLFRSACKVLGRANPDLAKQRKLEKDIRLLRSSIRELENKATASRLAKGDSGDLKRTSAELETKRKTLARLTRISEQKDFRRAMRITGMGLRVEEVVRFASVMAVLAFFLALAIVVPAAMWFGLEPMMLLAVSAAGGIAVPLTVFMLLVNYPERLAKSLEMEAFGSAPEVVNYMVMSMELSPSIDRAMLFAAENAEGPMAEELKSLVWKIKAREFATTEDALMAYAGELEGMNEELRSAIYNILSATKEREHEKMRSSLRRASDAVLTGTRQRVEGFAASLGTPAMVLFSLGILLPMIIGSMLPMISMGGFQMGPQPETQTQESWAPVFVLSVLAMNIMFPMVALVYAKSILAKRPGVHTVALADAENSASKMAGGATVIAIFIMLAYLVGNYLNFWGIQWSIAALLAVLGIAAGLWYALQSPKNRMKELEKLEDQMPDMLFQLGSRLGEGLALEKALEDVASTMKATEMGEFLSSVLSRMRRSGTGLADLLFSPEAGMMNSHPSRKLRVAMKLIVEAASKDPETAGSMLITMSNHMRDLANADKEMRLKLRSTIDSMKNTAILFAPVIMGVTVGLYRLLADTFGDMNGAETMPSPYFIMIIGIYLLATVATIMYFCSGIEHGRGRWKRDTAIALPVAAAIFCATSIGALLAFG
jgi:Flp pilus assembly protein TadB